MKVSAAAVIFKYICCGYSNIAVSVFVFVKQLNLVTGLFGVRTSNKIHRSVYIYIFIYVYTEQYSTIVSNNNFYLVRGDMSRLATCFGCRHVSAAHAAETCHHALNKSCSYSMLWNIVVYRRK